jgi:hypothetical protein
MRKEGLGIAVSPSNKAEAGVERRVALKEDERDAVTAELVNPALDQSGPDALPLVLRDDTTFDGGNQG